MYSTQDAQQHGASSTAPTTFTQPLFQWMDEEAKILLKTNPSPRLERLINLYLPSRWEETPAPCDYHWNPPERGPSFATTANNLVIGEFRQLPFMEVLRACFGAKSVWVERLYSYTDKIRQYYESFDEPHRYMALEKDLESHYAFTFQLMFTRPDRCSGLGLLFRQIRDVFERPDIPMVQLLERLAILSIRYNRCQYLEQYKEWRGLSCDFDALDKINSENSWKVALSLTETHMKAFGAVAYDDFPCSERLDSIIEDSNGLSVAVNELCLADMELCSGLIHRSLIDKMTDITVNLCRLRNFHAAISFLQGFENASCRPRKLRIFLILLPTVGNYGYRKHWIEGPGLPYVPFHIRAYHLERGRADFLQFVRYFEWRQQGKEDSLTSYIHEPEISSVFLRYGVAFLFNWLLLYLSRTFYRFFGSLPSSDLEMGLPARRDVQEFLPSKQEGVEAIEAIDGTLKEERGELFHSVTDSASLHAGVSITANDIGYSYTFAHLSFGPRKSIAPEITADLVDTLAGPLHNVPSIIDLPDGSFELVVRQSYLEELKGKLMDTFPGCAFREYDPTVPSFTSIVRSGYERAKLQAEDNLIERAGRVNMWDIAAKYYTYREEAILQRRKNALDGNNKA